MANYQSQVIKKFKGLGPAQVLVLGFAGTILVGSILLALPVSSANGEPIPYLDALFTATSAVCVTGLVLYNTADQFSAFGQGVILALIQIGGLGIMTMSVLLSLLVGKRITLKERLIIQQAYGQFGLSGMVKLIHLVLKVTLIVEFIGALLLSIRFSMDYEWKEAIYLGVFHSISAFNNAGFDLFANSLEAFTTDVYLNIVFMTLIILGGFGFTVVAELYSRRLGYRGLSLHTKLVLWVSAALILLPTFVIMISEYTNPQTLGNLSVGEKFMAALFQSVTSRTAGFNTIPTDGLRPFTLLTIVFLMFIGGSPASTAGGIKTTTFGAMIASIWTTITGKQDIEVFNRRLPREIADRAIAISMMAFLLVSFTTFGLLATEGKELMPTLFEATSAFGTVGLSTGLTEDLSSAGKMLIIFTMFAGRLGPLTLATALAQKQKQFQKKIHLPEERLLVG